jgi:hypothetical protein
MQTPTTFSAASAQAAAIPESIEVPLSSGASATVHRLSWLQFEALWSDMAGLLTALAEVPVGPQARRYSSPEDEAEYRPAAGPTIQAALAAAPQFVLRLAAQCLRLGEGEVAAWPPADVLACAAAGLELNFIQPAGVRSFFTAVGRLGAPL